jgi:integrase
MTGVASSGAHRLDLSSFDRSPALSEVEKSRIAGVAVGESLHIRFGDPLARLLEPPKARLRLTKAQPCQYSLLRHLVNEMHARQRAYWGWRKEEWTCVYRRCKEAKTASNTLQHVMALAALLCGVDLPELRNADRRILRRYALAIKIFGQEPVDCSIAAIHEELKRLGYTGYFHAEVRNALCELFLVHQCPDHKALSPESLHDLRRQNCARALKQATFMISHAMASLGLIEKPLSELEPIHERYRLNESDSIAPEWLEWCRRWRNTSTLRPRTRQSQYYRLLVVGRWLKATRPEITRPDQWTRQVAAEYLAQLSTLRVGQYVDDPRTANSGKLLSASSRIAHIASVRCFFSDLVLWDMIPYRFDPRQAFKFPRSVTIVRSPNPRIISEDVWAKLLWAGLNLDATDLPRSKKASGDLRAPRFPFELVRALALVWLFAGLRKDEVARLRVGCIRWQKKRERQQADLNGNVCLLEVPANKTSGAFTKPVHGVVGEAIEAWQQVRPKMPPTTDTKTGEVFDMLFCYRGRPVGNNVLNGSIIPMLCRKAGVPRSDLRGQITSHRARSTIATQLYNANEPMSLVALKQWLGHRRLESTQWYAAVTPDKLTQAYVDARYFERNVAVVQVLLDRAAIETGAAARGEAYKYVHLGHGYCANPYWAQCQHRMACQRCDFYVPGNSTKAQALEASTHNQHLLEQIPMTETERKALAGDQEALKRLSEACVQNDETGQ